MLRSGASAIARRAILRSSTNGTPACAVPRASFHLSAPRKEESKDEAAVVAAPESKGGLFGTGLSEWLALPVGMTAAIPVVHFDWYVINEETQLAAVFVAFCVCVYTQGGEAIHKSLDERAVNLLKEHNESEDRVIEAMETKLDFLKNNLEQVAHFESIHDLRGVSYERLNVAGAVRPQYEFKAQVERVLEMIASEEASVTEKTKATLMEEATVHVSNRFDGDKKLKKAALDAAIATIKGGDAGAAADPVKACFVDFFKTKAAGLAKADDGSEAAANRANLVTKINSIAKNEKFYFSFDANGAPKVNV